MHQGTSSTTALWIVATLVLVAGGIYGLIQLGGPPSTTAPVDRLTDADHVQGSASAKVVLIEYSDFQCPACGAYYPIVKQLGQTFSDELAIVYRHFPLRSIHKNADIAARAAEASGKQDKFFEIHDLLFEQQEAWSDLIDPTETFVGYATKLGLDLERFRNDLRSDSTKDRVNRDYQSGIAARVQGTPTFFLNGKKINNPRSFEEFRKLIESAKTE